MMATIPIAKPADVHTNEDILHFYTTQDEMELIFSETGVELRQTDNDETDEVAINNEIIVEATTEMNMFLEQVYRPADLARSRWVRRMASYIGCHLLSIRHGNPSQYTSVMEKLYERLDKLQQMKLFIPGVPTRENLLPGYANLVVEDRWYWTNSGQKIVNADVARVADRDWWFY